MTMGVVARTDQGQYVSTTLFSNYELAKRYFEELYKTLKTKGMFSNIGPYGEDIKSEDSFYLACGDFYESCNLYEEEVIDKMEELEEEFGKGKY